MSKTADGAALAQRPETEMEGTFHQAEVVNDKLKRAVGSEVNLVTPATRVGSLPPGCGVAMSVIYVDSSVDSTGNGADVYKVDGGKLALQKHVLDRIGGGLGIKWKARESGRTDDRSDPHYCSYRMVGEYRTFDGQLIPLHGEYEFDLREGSERAREATAKNLRQMRKFILQRAETGARCRAISSVGVKRAYRREELDNPFVIAKLHFDGHTDDPALKPLMAQEVARAMLGTSGTQALYPAAAPALPAHNPETGEIIEHPQEPQPPARSGVLLPDKDKTPIEDADVEQLDRWAVRIEEDLDAGVYSKGQAAERKQLLEAITVEIERRGPDSEKY